MTEQEAIKAIKKNFPKTAKMVDGRYKGGFDDTECDFGKALLLSISTLEEIQQYRALGTVEQIEERMLLTAADETILREYKELGAVEELREARKKQREKKPIRNDMCTCPSCGTHNETIKKRRNTVDQDIVYCWHCGQAMEVKRSMEDD